MYQSRHQAGSFLVHHRTVATKEARIGSLLPERVLPVKILDSRLRDGFYAHYDARVSEMLRTNAYGRADRRARIAVVKSAAIAA